MDDPAQPDDTNEQQVQAAERQPVAVRRSRRKKSHRSSRLDPVKVARLRQYFVILQILAAVVALIGGAAWAASCWNQDPYQHAHQLRRTGQGMLYVGGGILLLGLMFQWMRRLLVEIRERLNPPRDTSLSDTQRGRRGHRSSRKRRTSRPSAFSPK